MMKITIDLKDNIEVWAKQQSDLPSAITTIIEKHFAKNNFDLACDQIRLKVKDVPNFIEFTLQNLVGFELWQTLSNSDRLALGKMIKQNCASFGLEFIRKNSNNHSIYRKLLLET